VFLLLNGDPDRWLPEAGDSSGVLVRRMMRVQSHQNQTIAAPKQTTILWSDGMSRRAAAACGKIWSPLHWRDREWRSFARTDPTHRSKSAGVYEKARFATTVGDLQRDVFIERRAVHGLPAVIFPRPHSTCPVQINFGSRRCPLTIRYLWIFSVFMLLIAVTAICRIRVRLLRVSVFRADSLAGHVARILMERCRLFFAGPLYVWILIVSHGCSLLGMGR
jgi:hypothetical protein